MCSSSPWWKSSGALLCALALAAAPARVDAAVAALPAPAAGKVYLTVDEALALAFPDASVERRTVYLTDAQKRRAEELAGGPLESGLAFPYVATREGQTLGTAYFDTHRVRTLRETLMVVVSPAGTIARIEVLAFGEPPDYLPRGSWYAQFLGRPLDDELRIQRGIQAVTGATLTARATTEAARRVLALHAVLGGGGE